MKKTTLFTFVTLAFALLATPVAAAPGLMNYSGRLVDASGAPVITPQSVTFTFWDSESGGTQLGNGYIYETTVTPNVDGLYAVSMGGVLGTGGAIPADIFDAPEVWLNVNIGGEDLAPRARINSVGYAFRADEATTAATALTAEMALHADHATNADHATSADSAASANEANHAATADQAITAQSSDLATTASFAQTAAHAASSTRADMATTAGTSLLTLGLKGSAFITAPSTGTAVQNGQALLAAYEQAKNLLPHGQPLSAANRAVLLVPPGRYDLTTAALVLDTEFVDVVGLSTARENQYIYGPGNGEGTGVIMQTTNTVRLENLTVECTRPYLDIEYDFTASTPAAYFPDTSTINTVLRNCVFKSPTFYSASMRAGVEYAGTYTDCVGGDCAFGGLGTASGTFTNCTGEDLSFGGDTFGGNGRANGTFTNCTGGYMAFAGGDNCQADGTFISCIGGDHAFGGHSGKAVGTFIDCMGGDHAFGGDRGEAGGTFIDCIGKDNTFGGGNGVASGTYTNCTGGFRAFGGGHYYGRAFGTFINCTGGDEAFGSGTVGIASGTFTHCTGGRNAFGNSGTAAGGKFRFCSGGPNSFNLDAAELSYCLNNGVPIP